MTRTRGSALTSSPSCARRCAAFASTSRRSQPTRSVAARRPSPWSSCRAAPSCGMIPRSASRAILSTSTRASPPPHALVRTLVSIPRSSLDASSCLPFIPGAAPDRHSPPQCGSGATCHRNSASMAAGEVRGCPSRGSTCHRPMRGSEGRRNCNVIIRLGLKAQKSRQRYRTSYVMRGFFYAYREPTVFISYKRCSQAGPHTLPSSLFSAHVILEAHALLPHLRLDMM